MSRPKKINESNKAAITAALSVKSRAQVIREFGLSYQMLQREFGKKQEGEYVVVQQPETSGGD